MPKEAIRTISEDDDDQIVVDSGKKAPAPEPEAEEDEGSLRTSDLREAKDEEDDSQDAADRENLELSDEDREERRRARREERKLQRQRRRENKLQDKARIQMLERRIEEMSATVGGVAESANQQQLAMLRNEIEQLDSYIARARQLKSAAQAAGDFEKANQIDDAIYEGRRRLDIMNNYQRSLVQPRVPAVDPALKANADDWISRRRWYNQPGNEEETEIVKAIDRNLVSSGWDPRSPEFWKELDRRAARRIPERYGRSSKVDDDDTDDADDDFEDRSAVRRQRPPMGGSARSERSTSTTEVLPKAFVQNLKDAGMWDDLKLRNKAIADFKRIRKEQPAA